jgi:hypothetical protein
MTDEDDDPQDSNAPLPPQETVDDPTRQLRDTIQERMQDYIELMRGSARAWDSREVDSKRLLDDSTALYEFAVRDMMWWFRQPMQMARYQSGSPSQLSVDVPIDPPEHLITLACSGLRHAQHGEHEIPQHAIAVNPNPVRPGSKSVQVSFDSFGKPAGAYVGKLIAWSSSPDQSVEYGDVIFYIGGSNQRF